MLPDFFRKYTYFLSIRIYCNIYTKNFLKDQLVNIENRSTTPHLPKSSRGILLETQCIYDFAIT